MYVCRKFETLVLLPKCLRKQATSIPIIKEIHSILSKPDIPQGPPTNIYVITRKLIINPM